MEDIRENEVNGRKLNTKECCFLCLRIEDVCRTDVENLDKVAKYCSMRTLLRHLQINENFVNKSSDSWPHVEAELIEVNLCKTCPEINANVAKICRKLEILNLELNYALECIHGQITDSAKDSDRVQNYSRRMTSDFEALSQLAFVDKLRKELARKCLKMRSGPIPIIQVTKFKQGHERAFIKQEQPTFEDESDLEMNYDPSSPSCSYHPYYAESESPQSSLTPEEIKLNVNPPPEVLEQKFPGPSTSSSSENKPTAENKLPKKQETRAYFQRVPPDVYCVESEATGMFHCKKCSATYKSLVGVRWHYKTAHLNLKQKCNLCQAMLDPTNIRRHERACRKNPQRYIAKQNNKKFGCICQHCGKKFDTRKKRYDHELHVHRNANRYPCHICDKKFNAQMALQIHVDRRHLRKRFSCRFCNKSYASSYKTRAHEKKCIKKRNIKVEPEVN